MQNVCIGRWTCIHRQYFIFQLVYISLGTLIPRADQHLYWSPSTSTNLMRTCYKSVMVMLSNMEMLPRYLVDHHHLHHCHMSIHYTMTYKLFTSNWPLHMYEHLYLIYMLLCVNLSLRCDHVYCNNYFCSAACIVLCNLLQCT